MTNKATLFLSAIGQDITAPFFNGVGQLHAILHDSGEIVVIDDTNGQVDTLHSTGGQPSGASFDLSDGTLYVADFAHAAVLAIQSDGNQESVVGVYEDRPLKGPHSILAAHGNIYFTDSGPLGETGLHSPTGSLFVISNSPTGQILKPIALNSLASPSGIALSPNGQLL